ncbi:MAG: hypothetical protein DWI45_00845 [Chloroflexi bacterium]|nr:MAG: hypothetical protein DWI45_00845 [Chloroflexota bacterium]
MNLVGQGLPLAIVAALLATLAVTGARRAAWIALAALVLVAGVLEFPDDGHYPAGLLLRLAALWGATLIVLPTGLFDFAALRRDLSPRVIAETLSEHPVVAASALAGLLLGAVPLALPIETSVAPVRAAGIALLVIGLPPLLTSGYVEATGRAAVVALTGALLLRASVLGALDPLAAVAIAAGLAAILLISSSVAGQITLSEEE